MIEHLPKSWQLRQRTGRKISTWSQRFAAATGRLSSSRKSRRSPLIDPEPRRAARARPASLTRNLADRLDVDQNRIHDQPVQSPGFCPVVNRDRVFWMVSEIVSQRTDGGHAERGGSRAEQSWYKKLFDPVALFTLLLSIATVGLVYVGELQRRTLEKTDETQRMFNRAFIFPVAADLALVPTPGFSTMKWNFVPQWENSGNTATVDLKVETRCGVLVSQRIEPSFGTGAADASSNRVIGPHQKVLGEGCSFGYQELSEAMTRKKFLYILMRATYKDVFGAMHITEFCAKAFILIGNLSDPYPTRPIGLSNGASCLNHNCADEQCGLNRSRIEPANE
jgi:hypothetical protein